MEIGLDSGSLTMFGSVVHSLRGPGHYGGVVHRGKDIAASFSIFADEHNSVDQVNIDLAKIGAASNGEAGRCLWGAKRHFVVNPRGSAVFHVSGGLGGFSVQLRRAEGGPNVTVFDSRTLEEGDVFSAIVIRPGRYRMTNLLTQVHAELSVAYPQAGKTAYRAPAPLNIECTRQSFEPGCRR
jgi:hypothetical protein